jgi:hypothetical protein
VVATRDNKYHDLWWAHTGGGGGNFGVVTRYLMRSPGATGPDPAKLLPTAPASLLSSVLLYDWKTVTKAGFVRTLRNFFDFYERHNTGDSPYASLYSPLILTLSSADGFLLSTQLDGSVPDAAKLLKAFNAAMVQGVDPKPAAEVDLADPEWNSSGVPWHELYYQGNYPRLQRIKAQWDPRNVFQHRLSIRPPENDWGAGPDPRGTGPTPR